ncbi:MAG: ABC transporter permease [Candidatus Saccharimonas sp.]
MGTTLFLVRFFNKQSRFRVIATTASVVLATLILLIVASLGQGWLARQQKEDFVEALFTTTRETTADKKAADDSVYLSLYNTHFQTLSIKEVGVRVASQGSKLPVGLSAIPPQDELWVTPALKRLIDTNQLLQRRYQEYTIKDTFPESLAPSPDSLLLLFYIPDTARNNPQARLYVTTVADIDMLYNDQKERSNLQNQLFHVAIMVIGVILAVPILILITEVARIGMLRREKRYAALSLVGATIKQVRTMVAVEALPASLAGVAVGLILFSWVGIPLLAHIPLGEGASWVGDVRLSGMLYGSIGVLVVLCVLLANLQAVQRANFSPLTVSRSNGVKKSPSVFTMIPLLLGVGALSALAMYGKAWYADNMGVGGILVAALLSLIIVGIFFGGPYMTYVMSFVVARIARRAEGVMAAYRLRFVSRTTFHSVSGIVIALFVGTLLVTSMATMQRSSEIQDDKAASSSDTVSANQLWHSLQIKVTMSSENIDDALVGELQRSRLIGDLSTQAYVQQNFQEYGDASDSLSGDYYDSCQQLQQRTRIECRDSFPGPVVLTLKATGYGLENSSLQREAIPVGTTKGKIFASNYTIVAKDQAAYDRLTQLVEDITSRYQRKTGIGVDIQSDNLDTKDTITPIKNLSGLMIVALAIVVMTGGLSLFVSVVGGIDERKRTLVQLRILGASLASLVCSLVIEIIVPLIVLSIIAVGLGMFCSYLLLSLIGAFGNGIVFAFPGILFWAALLATYLFCAMLSLAAFPIIVQLTKEDIWVE